MNQVDQRQRLVARIEGRVQGVGFRYWVRRQALRMGLTGWVMNLDDERSVQVVAEGEPVQIDHLEQLLRAGPPGSRVEQLEARREPASGEWQRFEITRP
ncbi:MAG: acylphosphatase [Chloroflexota bacterium]